MRYFNIRALVVGFSLLGPGSVAPANGGQRGTIHPTPTNLPEANEVTYVLEPGAPVPFFTPDPSVEIGRDDGADHELIGDIGDVAVDRNGLLFLLDSEFNVIRVYDYDGRYVTSFGRPGEGPGELRHIRAIDVSDDGNTAVVVGGSRFVVVFRRNEADSTFAYAQSFTQAGTGYGDSVCLMNGHIYVLGYSPEHDGVVFKYTLNGDLVSSFGKLYADDDEFVVSSLSQRGIIACSKKHGVIGWVRRFVPVFTGLSENGAVLWQILFASFEPSLVEERIGSVGRTGLMYTIPEDGQSVFTHILVGSTGAFYVSYDTEQAEGPALNHTFRVEPGSGTGRYVGQTKRVLAIDEPYVIHRLRGMTPRVGITIQHYRDLTLVAIRMLVREDRACTVNSRFGPRR